MKTTAEFEADIERGRVINTVAKKIEALYTLRLSIKYGAMALAQRTAAEIVEDLAEAAAVLEARAKERE